jgi:uncharacterized protein
MMMRVLLTGASGLVGKSLTPHLLARGWQVVAMTRSPEAGRADFPKWDPGGGRLDPAVLEGYDAVVHLCGENIAAGRWTSARMTRIRDSRVQSTRLLCEGMSRIAHPPRVLGSASAVGYYGNRGTELLTEDSPSGSGFLAGVCREWEAATAPAQQCGVRVVHLRFGMILSPVDGALARMLPVFRLGAGGRLGDGAQYQSWIALDDAVAAVGHALATEGLSGPVNVVAPESMTNQQFTRILGRVLRRPTFLRAPAFALRAVLGLMADDVLLASIRALPQRLSATGFAFRYPRLEPALRHLLTGGG